MQTRRDQVDAHRFAAARLNTALAHGDPGRGEGPFRRAGLGVFTGTVLAALIAGGALVLGLISPSPSAAAWRRPDALVVEKESGTRFVYLNGRLHPVANTASAMLLAGAGAAPAYVPARTLADAPQGAAVGIPGGPDLLPAAAGLLRVWSLCLDPARPGRLSLRLGAIGGPATPVTGRVLAAGPGETGYVVWDGVKYPLPSRASLVALGLGGTEPVQAPAAWLAALPTGPALAPPPVPGAGLAGPDVAGRPAAVGRLFDSGSGGDSQFYVLLGGGLAPISRTEFALLAAAPRTRAPVELSPAEVAAAPAAADPAMVAALPDLIGVPTFQPAGPALCVRRPARGRPQLAVSPRAVPAAGTTVSMPAGSGMLASPAAGPRAAAYLITAGQRFLLASGAAQALGYRGAAVHRIPAPVLALILAGPALSQQDAAREVP